jgi:hypothetical protein
VSITIDDDMGRMSLVCGDVAAQAVRNTDGSWRVPERDGTFTRDQAITALTIIERRAGGAGDDDPHIRGWEAELAGDA